MKIKASKKSFVELINRVDWTLIQTKRGLSRLSDDQVVAGFFPSAKDSTLIEKVKIRFGKDVINKLGWAAGEKIYVFHDPDDLLLFMLVKSDSSKTATLSNESRSTSFCVNFTWRPCIKLKFTSFHSVDYEIHNGKLIFRIGNPADDMS